MEKIYTLHGVEVLEETEYGKTIRIGDNILYACKFIPTDLSEALNDDDSNVITFKFEYESSKKITE